MIEVHESGPVTQIRMCQTMGGRPLYWVAAWLITASGDLTNLPVESRAAP